MTNTRLPVPDVPLPDGARTVGTWEDVECSTTPWRSVVFASRQVTDHTARVSANACQYSDGHVDSVGISVAGLDYEDLNSDQARELAAALLEAAEQLDKWAAR